MGLGSLHHAQGTQGGWAGTRGGMDHSARAHRLLGPGTRVKDWVPWVGPGFGGPNRCGGPRPSKPRLTMILTKWLSS